MGSGAVTRATFAPRWTVNIPMPTVATASHMLMIKVRLAQACFNQPPCGLPLCIFEIIFIAMDDSSLTCSYCLCASVNEEKIIIVIKQTDLNYEMGAMEKKERCGE